MSPLPCPVVPPVGQERVPGVPPGVLGRAQSEHFAQVRYLCSLFLNNTVVLNSRSTAIYTKDRILRVRLDEGYLETPTFVNVRCDLRVPQLIQWSVLV